MLIWPCMAYRSECPTAYSSNAASLAPLLSSFVVDFLPQEQRLQKLLPYCSYSVCKMSCRIFSKNMFLLHWFTTLVLFILVYFLQINDWNWRFILLVVSRQIKKTKTETKINNKEPDVNEDVWKTGITPVKNTCVLFHWQYLLSVFLEKQTWNSLFWYLQHHQNCCVSILVIQAHSVLGLAG